MKIPEAGDADGLDYFANMFELTSGLDGSEVIRGFLAGIQEGLRDE